MPEAFNKARFPLMFLGLLALLTALWGGLLRLGWALPLLRPTLSVVHGPLMVCGFLGTLIGVERAVALGAFWPYAAPLCTKWGRSASSPAGQRHCLCCWGAWGWWLFLPSSYVSNWPWQQ